MQNQHRRWVANHLPDKASELKYFLAHIVDGAADSLRQFHADKPQEESTSATRAVVFGFSAFTNAMQALKDSFTTATGENMTWTHIAALQHGQFFYEARNAATHDGHPVVNTWIEGHFRVLLKIERYDNKNNKIEIVPPQEDVPTMCLQFAADFCELLIQRLRPHLGRAELRGARFTEDQLDGYANSPFVPEFARRLLQEQRGEHIAQLQASDHDPIDSAIEKLTEARDYAHSALRARSST
jgi:hypothetical protein